eukprot:365456-Chlamydomonas_euryale.AAC.10
MQQPCRMHVATTGAPHATTVSHACGYNRCPACNTVSHACGYNRCPACNNRVTCMEQVVTQAVPLGTGRPAQH